MAEDQQNNQGTPQQPQQPQPPAPPPNAQQIIAAQQAAIRQQIAEAQARDRAQFGGPSQAGPPAPVMGGVFAQGAQEQQQGQQPPQGINLPQGMTPQQVAQGVGRAPSQGFAQSSQQKEPEKSSVRWHPSRNSALVIELDDVLLKGLPDSIEIETDPAAKVVAALLSEILSLRTRVAQLEQGGGGTAGLDELSSRVRMLESTLFEQTQALKQQARAFREEQERKMRMEGEGKEKEE